jgi:plastocyanin
MATGSLPASSPSRLEQERYIERQLNKTRRQVKLVEVGVATVTLLAGMLAFFLVAAVIDHWILPLGTGGRFALLMTLLAATGWYVWSVLVPLVRNSINPAYAALTIEHSAPTLKNSLINFLMLRSQRGGVHDVVYEAVEQRAANDLKAVPLDSVIDYGHLIKVGYVLAAMFALSAAYKILSPKDPLQTMARVAAPWADIARPSRVQIESVTPGDAEMFFGDGVPVVASLRGVRTNDRVALVFSTSDGQTVNKAIELVPDDSGLRFTGHLPGEGQGLQQDVTYRLEAGDAISRDYRLTVVSAPTIVVEHVDYEFPRYTQKPREARERVGDLRALEGTRVTLRAKANQTIHSAYVEFDPVTTPTPGALPGERVAMQVNGDEATGSFVLELTPDRGASKHGSYQITFMTASGHAGQHPAHHSIEVIRDLSPEVEILAPEQPTVEVPENGAAQIEVRAVDPDFALSRVGLKFTAGARELADKSLLSAAQNQKGQATSKFTFRPSDYKLKAGDEVAWWATAGDNRTAPKTALPEPNTARTKNHFFKIIAADPHAKNEAQDPNNEENGGQDDQPNNGDQPPKEGMPPMQNENNGGGEQNAGEQNDSKNDQQPDKGEQKQDDTKKPMSEQGGNSGSQGGESDKPMDGENKSKSDGAGQSGKNDGDEQPMPEDGMGDKKNMKPMPGTNAGKSDGAGTKTDQPQDGGKPKGENQGGEDNQGQPSGDNGEGKQEGNDKKAGGNQGQSDGVKSKPDQGDNQNDSPREKPHDGEVFEKAIERMIEQLEKQQKEGGQGKSQPENAGGQKQPTQEDFDRLPEHLKERLKKLLQKNQEQGDKQDGQQKNEKPTPGVKGESSKESAQGGNQQAAPDGQSQTGDEQPESPIGEGSQKKGGADKKQGAGANNQRGQGQTGKSDETAKTRPEPKTDSNEPKTDEERQGGLGTNGSSGAGQASTNKKGAAEPQEANRDKPKSQQSPDQPPSENDEAQSPSGSKMQSDSQGGEGGDRSGGGKKGPGQPSKAAGNDAAGSNSEADEGAGAAQTSGDGETSSGAGNKKKAEGKTGTSGADRGEGSSTQKGPMGDRKSADNAEGDDSDEPPGEQPSGQGDTTGKGKSGDVVTGGGKPSDNNGKSKYADAEGPAAEKAKLDYAASATDLVLEYLKNSKDKPDQELLDDLGWTQEDMQRFLQRWSEAKREAAEDPKTKGELDESLRSLGLRAAKDKLRRAETKNDNNRGLGDVGPTSGPPPKYLEQFRAFKKGAAREK